MPHLTVPEDTCRRLTAKAASLGISVDDLVRPILDQLGEASVSPLEPQPPLTEDAWFAEIAAWKRDAESRAGRYPRGFVLDDRREKPPQLTNCRIGGM